MPNNMIKTKRDEKLWNKAVSIVGSQYKDVQKGSKQYYRLVTGIYERMRGSVKEGEATTSLKKSEFSVFAEKIARDYFKAGGKEALDDLVVKTAIMEKLNKNQVQTLCSSTNHVIHAALMAEKKADKNKYLEYEIARPENVLDKISSITSVPDDIYLDAESVFKSVQKEKQAEELSPAELYKNAVRRGDIIRQNIKSISEAYQKTAGELELENSIASGKIDKLYNIIKNAIQTGSDVEDMRMILVKPFGSDSENFEQFWDYVVTRLMAERVIKRPVRPEDRPEYSSSEAAWAPNASNPVISMASEVNRRMNKSDALAKRLIGLEKIASEAVGELSGSEMEKEAFLGAVLPRAGLIAKSVLKKIKPVSKSVFKKTNPAGKATVKPPGKIKKAVKNIGRAMTPVWVGMEAVPVANKKTPKVWR